MKTPALLAAAFLLQAPTVSMAEAASYVSQAVFSITSSAKTATPNLRVVPMTPKTAGRDDQGFALQFFQWQAKQAANYYLTKSTTVDLSQALCAWVQVDQATKVVVNSETAYMTLPSGYNGTVCFK